ncbi:replication initiation protein [Nocardia sp. NPDC049737]|uniref:replication initiation protein n=1 Tax=Nocardia sp. NPDC049737 TaxID=3154358 RepID=UPI00342C97DF
MAPRQTLMTDGQWAIDVLLPHRPHATNRLRDGQYRMSREDALEMRYIEHSPYALIGALVVDVDHPDTALRAFERPKGHPDPNWVAQSPSGRGHIGWWLKAPVCRTDSARLAPLRFAQRIEAGLRIEVGGDPAYAGRLTKNPIHDAWETIYGPAEAYDLAALVTPSTPRQMPRKPERASGLGRNVTMFDSARKWAYPMWWHHRNGTQGDWEHLVLDYCRHEVNELFGYPLPFSEVLATSTSISRWIWRNFSEEGFREKQSIRGKIMTEKRQAAIVATNKKRAIDRATVLAALEE